MGYFVKWCLCLCVCIACTFGFAEDQISREDLIKRVEDLTARILMLETKVRVLDAERVARLRTKKTGKDEAARPIIQKQEKPKGTIEKARMISLDDLYKQLRASKSSKSSAMKKIFDSLVGCRLYGSGKIYELTPKKNNSGKFQIVVQESYVWGPTEKHTVRAKKGLTGHPASVYTTRNPGRLMLLLTVDEDFALRHNRWDKIKFTATVAKVRWESVWMRDGKKIQKPKDYKGPKEKCILELEDANVKWGGS